VLDTCNGACRVGVNHHVFELVLLVPRYGRLDGTYFGVVCSLAWSEGLGSAIDNWALAFLVECDAPAEAGCPAEGAIGPGVARNPWEWRSRPKCW